MDGRTSLQKGVAEEDRLMVESEGNEDRVNGRPRSAWFFYRAVSGKAKIIFRAMNRNLMTSTQSKIPVRRLVPIYAARRGRLPLLGCVSLWHFVIATVKSPRVCRIRDRMPQGGDLDLGRGCDQVSHDAEGGVEL